MSKNFGRTFDNTDAPTERRTNAARASNDNVRSLRSQATALLIGSCFLAIVAPPVGAVGIVAGLGLLALCPLLDSMTTAMSAEAKQGGGCMWPLIVAVTLAGAVLALGGGLALFGEMAGRL